MDFNIKPTAYSPSTALSAKEMVALAASLWVQMGVATRFEPEVLW